MRRPITAALMLLATAAPARAIVTFHDHEQHGSAAVNPGSSGGWAQVAAVLNLQGRVYWGDRGSTGFHVDHHAVRAAYRGGADELNAALHALAELPAVVRKDVVLLPGAGAVRTKDGVAVGCDWRVRIEYTCNLDLIGAPPNTPRERMTVALAVFLPDRPSPAPAAAPADVDAWIADLDSPRFAERERAFQELARRAASVRPALERALAGKPTAEQRARLERLRQQAAALDLGQLRVPPGVRVISFDGLVARERPMLLRPEPAVLWEAANELHDAVECTDLLPLLTAQLDERELAALTQKTKDAPKNYLTAFLPLTTDPAPTPEARAAAAERYRELRRRIDTFCQSLAR
jgi:hypothetical protein